MHRAFQPLEQVDAHQSADALFTPCLRQAVFALMVQIGVLCHPTGKNVVGRRVNAQRQADDQIVNFAVGDRVRQIGQRRPLGNRRQARRKVADLVHVVVFFNVFSGTRNRNAVQNLKEIEVQHPHQLVCGAQLRIGIAPCVKGFLRVAENFFYAPMCGKLVRPRAAVALIGQRKLVAQVIEAVIHRCCRQHQHPCPCARTDDLVHKPRVAVFLALFVGVAAVAEIVRFIDHHKVIRRPIQPREICSAGEAARA